MIFVYVRLFWYLMTIHECFISGLTYRTCSLEGKWEGRYPNESLPRGYTHYLLCLNPHYRMLMDSINQGGQAEVSTNQNFFFHFS